MNMETTGNKGYVYPPNYPMRKENLPHSVPALIISIVSLATMAYFGWIMAIIALSNANKALKIAGQYPGRYSDGSLRMANAGRNMGIIGLVLGLLGIIVWILYFVFIFALVSWASHTQYHYY